MDLKKGDGNGFSKMGVVEGFLNRGVEKRLFEKGGADTDI